MYVPGASPPDLTYPEGAVNAMENREEDQERSLLRALCTGSLLVARTAMDGNVLDMAALPHVRSVKQSRELSYEA